MFEDNEVEQPAAKRGPKPKSLKEKEAKRKEKEVLEFIFYFKLRSVVKLFDFHSVQRHNSQSRSNNI